MTQTENGSSALFIAHTRTLRRPGLPFQSLTWADSKSNAENQPGLARTARIRPLQKAWAAFSSPSWASSRSMKWTSSDRDRRFRAAFRGSKWCPVAASLETLVHFHFLHRPQARERVRAEAETTVTTVSVGGIARKPFHQCACSLERERVAAEWPCGGALSGSWSRHASTSAD
jgi:hypothetical protein